MSQRHSVPEPKFTYELNGEPVVKPDSRGYHLPLARHLSTVIGPNDLVLDVGCGLRPLSVLARSALETRADVSALSIIAVDSMTEPQMRSKAQVPLGRGFCYAKADVNSFKPEASLDPEQARGECRDALLKVQEFLGGQNPAEAKADVVVAGGILHYVGLGKPVDALLSMLRPDGRMVVSGVPDYQDTHERGRTMADLARYLAEDGEVKNHLLTGFVLSESGVKETGRKALAEALKKKQKEVPPEFWRRAIRSLADDPRDGRGGYGVMPVSTKTRPERITVSANVGRGGTAEFYMMPRRINDGEHEGKYLVSGHEVFTVQLSPDAKPKQGRGLWSRLFGR